LKVDKDRKQDSRVNNINNALKQLKSRRS